MSQCKGKVRKMTLPIFGNNFLMFISIFPLQVRIMKQNFTREVSFGMGCSLGMGETTIMLRGVCNNIEQGLFQKHNLHIYLPQSLFGMGETTILLGDKQYAKNVVAYFLGETVSHKRVSDIHLVFWSIIRFVKSTSCIAPKAILSSVCCKLV